MRSAAGAGLDRVGGPAVDGLHPRPGAHLQVGARIARLDEAIPRRRVDGRHDRIGRRSTSAMTPTIDGSSGIRKATDTPA